MLSQWICQQKNDKLILFFNGWAMDSASIKHLDCTGFDVLECHDYTDLTSPLPALEYKEIYLVAWSMGVLASCFYTVKTTRSIALAGTPYLVHDQYGIPEKAYAATVNRFCPAVYKRFIKNCRLPEYAQSQRQNKEALHQELQALQHCIVPEKHTFDTAFIPQNDGIIPASNQHAFWASQPDTRQIALCTGHYVFEQFTSWDGIIHA